MADFNNTAFGTIRKVIIADFSDHYGFDAKDVPRIDVFLNDVEPPVGTSAYLPDWAGLLYRIVGDIQSCTRLTHLTPLIVEIAVINEPGHGEEKEFSSKIVYVYEENKSNTIYNAYSQALREISRNGTTIATDAFHRLHYVYIAFTTESRPGVKPPTFKLSHYSVRNKVVPAPELKAHIDPTYALESHHRTFVQTFLHNLAPDVYLDHPAKWHYVAIPFQRPASIGEELEPAGAVYLVLAEYDEPSNPSATSDQDILEIVTRIQYFCSLASLKQKTKLASVLSTTALSYQKEAEIQREKVSAYDNIGHTLRTFVEATEYVGALRALRDIEHTGHLSEQHKRQLARARKSLSFFKHAEALGSLMRLHGWVANRNNVHQRRKIEQCFNSSNVSALLNDTSREGSYIEQMALFVQETAWPFANRYGVHFDIQYLNRAGDVCNMSVDASRDDVRSYEESRVDRDPGVHIFDDTGDNSAVLLALLVAIVEPLRNAARYMESRRYEFAAATTYSEGVDILIENRGKGNVLLSIGNDISPQETQPPNLYAASGGLRLVNSLLRDCFLGGYRQPAPSTDEKQNTRLYCNVAAKKPSYVWVQLELTPLALWYKATLEMM